SGASRGWEALCIGRERSACRGVHGPRPVPSAALPGDLGAGVTLACGASVPPTSFRRRFVACGAIVPPTVIPAKAGTQYTVRQWWGRCLSDRVHPVDGRRCASIAGGARAETCMGPGLFPRPPYRATSAPG